MDDMNTLTRSRLIFLGIVGMALLVVCASLLTTNLLRPSGDERAAPPSGNDAATTTQPQASIESPPPIFAPNANLDDGLPTYICAADAFGSYFTLQQIQMGGYDVQNGFHLGIIPFLLDGDPRYDISEEQRAALLASGKWDCLLTTLDAVALSAPGVITAIVDESAGADQLWARDVATINNLAKKRITFPRGSVSEYFVYYTLYIARLNPRFDVTLVPADSLDEAIATFDNGQADAVAGWEPDILAAQESGGQPLLSSANMRIIMDVIVTSRSSILQKPDLVQAFHNAWFQALKAQVEDFETAARQIAEWGHNDWTFVYPDSAADDMRLWLSTIAQADLGDNVFVMRDPRPLLTRLETARRVWAAAGISPSTDDVNTLVDTRFVATAAANPALQPNGAPINDTFSISADIQFANINPDEAQTLAVLPCRRFTFLPESTELTLESRRILDECVVPTMQQSLGLYLRVRGSAAWPGPPGTYTEEEILEFARARAQSVVDYLVSQGIDPARFIVEATLPPREHWETEDPAIQAEDRYVEMTLITVGR